MKTFLKALVVSTFSVLLVTQTLAADERPGPRLPTPRPGLFFEETWQQIDKGGENPVSQAHVSNPSLELKLYGPMSDELQVTGIAVGEPGYDANPVHTWSGLCGAGCTFAFKNSNAFADLSGAARIMIQSKTSGFHKIRPFIRLADGNTYVGDIELGQTYDFLFEEFRVQQVNWIAFDVELGVTRGTVVNDLDLSRVDEIGFTDLQPGAGHGAGGWSDVAVMRVFAEPVPR